MTKACLDVRIDANCARTNLKLFCHFGPDDRRELEKSYWHQYRFLKISPYVEMTKACLDVRIDANCARTKV
jgi:hypothetical protein